MKLLAGIALVSMALLSQFFLASAGFHFNLALATLIALAFFFSFWELLVVDLLAVFIINWQPMMSVAIVAFAVIPLAAFAFHKAVHTEPWIGALAAILLGFLAFYLIAAPMQFLPHIRTFLEDAALGLVAGELVLFIVN